jgi:hypothetical protein
MVVDSIEQLYPIVHNDPQPQHPSPRSTRKRRTISASSTPAHIHQSDANDPGIIDDNLRSCLENKWTAKKYTAEKEQSGLVYIQQVVGSENLFKIGSTWRTAADRREEIRYKCGFQLQVEYRSSRRIELYKQAERLIHTELAFFRESFVCPGCGSQHEEYFRLSLADIEAVVLRWERFLAQRPYNAQGTLRDFWHARLDDHPVAPKDEKHEDHVQRGERWDTFIDATVLEQRQFQIVGFWTRLYATDYYSFTFWKRPVWFLWIAALLLTLVEWGFKGRYTVLRISLEILQALPLALVGSSSTPATGRGNKGCRGRGTV